MINKCLIARILSVSILLTVCFGCNNKTLNMAKSESVSADEAITRETPYYCVTNGRVIKERNHYMELEVKIPKIEYTNEDTNPVFDSINEEIENTILKLVDESKKNAYDTYMSYLETAKNNLENERAKKLEELKIKYKRILTDDEVKAIHEITDADVLDIATESFLNVDGFSSTEDIINAGPHNKKIIIVEKNTNQSETATPVKAPDIVESEETMSNGVKKANIKIEGRPGRIKGNNVPSVYNNVKNIATNSDMGSSLEKKDDLNESIVEDLGKADFEKGFAKKVASDSYIGKQIKEHFDEIPNDVLSKENFYKELKKIKRMRTPNGFSLTMGYTPMYIYCDFDVKCLDEDYISIYINMYETRAQSLSKVLFYNIDLKQKKLLSIQDVLGEEYKDICINSINKSIESWTEDKKGLLSENRKIEDFINEKTTFFINNNHIPVVVFDKYAITAGAAGYPAFQIIK